MNIVVYCGSSSQVADKYLRAAEELGAFIGGNGHQLVFGASDCGLMGVVARACHDHGGKVFGVGLRMFEERIGSFGQCDELFVADTFSVRREKMMELGDAFVALPGGTGTLDEISEVLCSSRFYFPNKPIFFLNTDGFYDEIEAFLRKAEREGFLYPSALCRVHFVSEPMDIQRHLS